MNIISSNGCDGGSEPHRDAARDTAAFRNGGAGIHEEVLYGMYIREERDASVDMCVMKLGPWVVGSLLPTLPEQIHSSRTYRTSLSTIRHHRFQTGLPKVSRIRRRHLRSSTIALPCRRRVKEGRVTVREINWVFSML